MTTVVLNNVSDSISSILLFQLGMLQSYNLGVYLRQRYIDAGFLSDTYLRKE
ncbi:hypothetical protein LSH36_95g07055, partial [Paralvinella palmiformis]